MSAEQAAMLPLVATAAPLVAALLILLLPERVTGLLGGLASIATVTAAALLLPLVRAGEPVAVRVLTLVPGVDLAFRVDALGITFALLAAGLWIVTSVYAQGYARADALRHRRRFFSAFAASIGATMGVAFAANLLTFFLFYELLTLATYPLVVHKESARAFQAGRRYLLFALGGGLAMLTAVAWTSQLAGTLDFRAGGMLPAGLPPVVLTALFALFVGGAAVKSAVMPLHAWLPGAMVAPTPVSALLHAVAVVKAGVFAMLRITGYVFGPDALSRFGGADVLSVFAVVTIASASVIALRQDNLKRRLAYSTIVHLSYIVLGAALVAPDAFAGAVLHMVNHGLAKITLFFCAGAIYVMTHRENVSDLAGLGHRMPWTFGAFTVASLALVGMPGMSGFNGKFFLARGALAADDLVAFTVMLVASAFTAAYLLPILRIAYFPSAAERAASDRAARGFKAGGEAPASMVGPLVTTAALAALFGFASSLVNEQFALASAAVDAVFARAAP